MKCVEEAPDGPVGFGHVMQRRLLAAHFGIIVVRPAIHYNRSIDACVIRRRR